MSSNQTNPWLTRYRGRLTLTAAAFAVAAWGCANPAANLGGNQTQGVAPRGTGTVNQGKGGPQFLSPEDVPGLKAPGKTDTAAGPAPGTAGQVAGPAGTTPGAAGAAGALPDYAPPTQPVVVNAAAAPGFTDVPVSNLPFNAAKPLTEAVNWTRPSVYVDPKVGEVFPKGGDATIVGRIIDDKGNPAANVPVMTELQQTTTNADGWYQIKAKPSPASPIRVGSNAAGYVPFDDFLGVYPNETATYHTQVLRLDRQVTRINIAQGGVAHSTPLTGTVAAGVTNASVLDPARAFGLFAALTDEELYTVYMEVPAGALQMPDGEEETEIRLTWLNPLPRDGKPYGDLYGPLQTYTLWNDSTQSPTPTDQIAPFLPVNFADLDLGGAVIKPGAEVKVKWVVGKEVERQYPISLTNGQAFFPCYQYDFGTGWTKPVLATVFQERGYFWATYTMRGSNSPAVVTN
ncbi:MAG: hypothetical protein VKS61_04600 [Candidatus Sericytochromatia bacterium]|nr:hypothetical protein [Candidatus Sericytochromatia bacterium]MEB3221338.1 hypothetical protein [Candidatus Sericytochromatia bacterium]